MKVQGAIIKKKGVDSFLTGFCFNRPVISENVLESHIFPDVDMAEAAIKNHGIYNDFEAVPIELTY